MYEMGFAINRRSRKNRFRCYKLVSTDHSSRKSSERVIYEELLLKQRRHVVIMQNSRAWTKKDEGP